MPTCIFILSRFTLRVDNVLFRVHDTRIYHSFASTPPLVVRETRGWEAPYERVKRVTAFFFCLPSSLCAHLRQSCARFADTSRLLAFFLVFFFGSRLCRDETI